jgi:hypothetical protein
VIEGLAKSQGGLAVPRSPQQTVKKLSECNSGKQSKLSKSSKLTDSQGLVCASANCTSFYKGIFILRQLPQFPSQLDFCVEKPLPRWQQEAESNYQTRSALFLSYVPASLVVFKSRKAMDWCARIRNRACFGQRLIHENPSMR